MAGPNKSYRPMPRLIRVDGGSGKMQRYPPHKAGPVSCALLLHPTLLQVSITPTSLNTNARFLFSGKTAYVAVTYLDRFLAQRRVDRGKEWALQLLSVACLSLAAKVEEHRVPRLPEFRPDEYDFDSASILRMELLVLGTLNWRMIAATPFPYLSCFAARFRHDERSAIVLRAVKCIFASIKGQTKGSIPLIHRVESDHTNKSSRVRVPAAMSSVEYQPSTMALASILAARGGSEGTGTGTGPSLEEELKAILGSSWQQLHTGHVYSCYSLMIQEEDRSTQSGREVAASSGVSAAAPTGSPGTSVAMADDNNAIATASADNNKRRRVHSPQPQRQ
ncbi:hypothetical protein TRIUR3_19238 [Triticum urartu]|uniref:Cyclin-like domain-containing protein n=1 Tax=Triticum urartu TaxID=4572 RepID=M8A0N9_TRIUA|nr:hypothetical protein TRIUR3_19238 [Triticum urartu]